MIEDLDAWVSLNQGGRLLERRTLEQLPSHPPLSPYLVDRLRDALTLAAPGSEDGLGALLDAVLQDVCGLRDGWRKGNTVTISYEARLVDGTAFRPRRVLCLGAEPTLAVVTTPVERVGLHKGRRVVAQVVEYLRRSKTPLGLVTNGREWRLIFADTDNLAWVEFVADRFLEGDQLLPPGALLRRILSPESLRPGDQGAPSALLKAVRETRRGQARLSKELGERVRRAVEHLLRERRVVLDAGWDPRASSDVYRAACHFIMRLVVVLFAEARELLPVDNPIYHHAYGLRGLLEGLERAGLERRRSRHVAWPRLLALFRLLHAGSPHPQLLVTAYGGDLFQAGDPGGDSLQQALARLELPHEPPSDEAIYQLVVLLTRTTERIREGATLRTVAAPVDFTELTSEYLGILYEGLLDYELHRAGEDPVIFLGLGDQPALPLGRLENMTDAQLKALVEKAKIKRSAGESEEGSEGDEPEDQEEEEAELELDEPPEESAPLTEDAPLDDAHAAARNRALAWAEKAALAGKLVRAPRGKKGQQDLAWKAELEAAARQIIADVKLPGEMYLVRWGGTRKGAGTFYTRPQLTLPTVRRTLEPLLVDADGEPQTPEKILSLKVCDPAMGSGSFLVAALRVLTEAVITSLHAHGRIQQDGAQIHVDCQLLPQADCDFTEDKLEAIIRRAVVEHCLYGVDLDPLAVELARVALWVETLDRRLPFTFLDHKLRCGDALVGTWLDRFRFYPLLAWWRQSPDEKWKGVHHKGDTWANALKDNRKLVVEEQRRLLAGELKLPQDGVSEEELKAAIKRVRELYRELRQVPASQPDKRATLWREKVARDPAMLQVREAFDTWCALWFWPLDSLADAPRPAELLAPSEKAREVVRALRQQKRFFHWELEFPDVFVAPGAGFDAIAGNPPWETRKPSSKEFFSDLDPLYRTYGKQDALSVQSRLFAADATTEHRWLDYIASFKDMGNFVRSAAEPFGDTEDDQGKLEVALVPRRADDSRKLHARWATRRTQWASKVSLSDPEHPFHHQGSADLNTYKMFIEQAHTLLGSNGQIGMVVPSGLYTDKGTGDLRKLLLNHCVWRWLYGFENRNKIFDIHRSFKFCVLIAAKTGQTEAIKAAFMRHDLEDWSDAQDAVLYPREQILRFSPHSSSILEIRNPHDLSVLAALYNGAQAMGESQVRYFNDEFHITKDSKLFPPRPHWEQLGFHPDAYGRWILGKEIAIPLYEGRIVGPHDPSVKGWVSGKGRTAEWEEISWDNKRWQPQYLIGAFDAMKSSYGAIGGTRVLFKKVTATTNARTVIAACTVRTATCDSAPILWPEQGQHRASLQLAATLNSYSFDFAMRARLGSVTITWQYLSESPVPRKHSLGASTIANRLGCAHVAFAPEWQQTVAHTDQQRLAWRRLWAVTPGERLRLRSMLDAIVATLYGLDRDEFSWILKDCDHPADKLSDKAFCRQLDPKGFWRVDKTVDPELRHTVLSLVAFDDLQTVITASGGDCDAGIQAFCDQHDGDGWMLPETLCLADHGLGHDERARAPQPVASRLGPRFLDWQLAQTPEESWAECERHTRAILGEEEFARRFGARGSLSPAPLFGEEGKEPKKEIAAMTPSPRVEGAVTRAEEPTGQQKLF